MRSKRSLLNEGKRFVQVRQVVDCVWIVMAHAQKPDFVFRRNGRVHLHRRGASVQSTTGSRGVRISDSNAGYTMFRGSVRVLATYSICQFPLHFPSRASPCAITFQLDSTYIISNIRPIQRQVKQVRASHCSIVRSIVTVLPHLCLGLGLFS